MATFASALGKVIVVGEHAVVYGAPAVAAAIGRGARARAERAERDELHLAAWGVSVTPREGSKLARAFRALLAVTPTSHPVRVDASTTLPPGGGLGSSAALGVAIARALDPAASHGAVVARAMEWERVFHGTPSGVDAEVAASSGCVFFSVGSPVERVTLPAPLLLCVGDSGRASSTGDMVASVAALDSSLRDEVFAELTWLAHEARAACSSGPCASQALGGVLRQAHRALRRLRVSTPELDRMCVAAEAAGAMGAKLTGAGGGGSVIALVGDVATARRVTRAWRDQGFTGFATRVPVGPGRVEQEQPQIEDKAS